MSIKNILSASLIVISIVSLNAQKDSSTTFPRYEIGINGTAFFKQFLSINIRNSTDTAASILETPYYLVSKFRIGKNYLRLGVGVHIQSDNESNTKTADYRINNNNDYQLRVGYEKQRFLNKKCLVYYGIDLLGGLNDLTVHSNTGFDFVTISDRSWTIGAAPVAGFQYRLWNNIVFSTETSIRYRYMVFGESAKFSKNVDFNENTQKLKRHKLDFIPPSVIYITFLF